MSVKGEKLRLRERISFSVNLKEQLDEANGVLKRVKVLGLRSQNGRDYTREAIRKAVPLLENARVYFDHPTEADEEAGGRSFDARFGRLKNITLDDAGEAWGDLKYNTEHKHAKSFLWYVKNDPADVGLSINGDGRATTQGDRKLVHAITNISSVDIVDGPATVGGIFEQTRKPKVVGTKPTPIKEQTMEPNALMDPAAPPTPTDPANDPAAGGGDWRQKLADLAAHAVNDPDATKAEILSKLKGICDLIEEEGGDAEPAEVEPADEGEEDEMMEQAKKFHNPAVRWAVKLAERARVGAKKVKLRERAKAAKLPDAAVTEKFLEQLVHAPVDEIDALIEDRRTVAVGGPRYVPPIDPKTGKKRSAAEIADELFASID